MIGAWGVSVEGGKWEDLVSNFFLLFIRPTRVIGEHVVEAEASFPLDATAILKWDRDVRETP